MKQRSLVCIFLTLDAQKVLGGDDRNIGLWNLKDNSLISVLEAQNYVMCLDVNEYGIVSTNI